jgi:two-component system, NarL family, response regulator DevR
MNTSNYSTHNAKNLPIKQSLRLMIVDDHEIVRHGLREVINTIKGFTVVAEASTCRDALAHIQRRAIDLVFMDLSLPDGDGMELVHALRHRDAPPYIIVLSATMNDDLLLETMLAGASGYLTKDVPAAEIARLLQNFHHGETVLTSPVASRLITLLIQKCLSLEMGQIAAKSETSSSTLPERQSLAAHPVDNLQDIASSPLSHLTPQEEKIFQLVHLGLSNKQIASQLSISRFTVGKHIQNILRKLGVTNRTQVASYTSFEGGKNMIDTSKIRD